MEWKAVLCAAVIGVTSFGVTPMQAVSAERENYKCEIPFVSYLYVYDGINQKHYYEIDMSVSAEITGKGDFVYKVYSQEDFQIYADTTLNIYSPMITINYDVPEWAMPKQTYGDGTVIKHMDSSLFGLRLNFSPTAHKDKKTIDFIVYPKSSKNYDVFSLNKGELLGEFMVTQQQPFFINEEGRCFVNNYDYNGVSKLFVDVEQPTYCLTLGDNNISRTLTNESVLNELSRNPTGDFNKDGAFSISDLVLLQKWLLGESILNTYDLDWQAANFCEDDRLDVFDLCLMRRTLIEK